MTQITIETKTWQQRSETKAEVKCSKSDMCYGNNRSIEKSFFNNSIRSIRLIIFSCITKTTNFTKIDK